MFHGWRLSGLSCGGNILLQGGGVYILNALIEPLTAAHGWSRGDIGTGQAIAAFVGMCSASLLTWLTLRVSIRALATLGALAGAAGYALMGVTDSLPVFIAALAVVWSAGQAFGGAVANTLMSRWFIRYRGRAFGIVNMGTSLSGAVLPMAVFLLMQVVSMRTALWMLSGILLCVAVPLCWRWVRDPDEMGLEPDGDAPAAGIGGSAGNATGDGCNSSGANDGTAATQAAREKELRIPWSTLARTPDVWRVGLAFAIGIMMAAGLVGQLKPKFADSGFDDGTAMLLMSFTALCGAGGKYLWGWVADRISALAAAKLLIIMSMASLTLHFAPQHIAVVLLFAVVAGSCMGGYWTMFPSVTAHVFGRRSFSAVYSFLLLFVSLKSVGYYIVGYSHRTTGSYDMAYVFFIVMLGVALAALHGTRMETPQAPLLQPAPTRDSA